MKVVTLLGLLGLPLAFAAEKTPPQAKPDQDILVTRIGIAGCHKQNQPAPALARYIEAEPDLMLWVGDNVYADTKDDINYLIACHQVLANEPAFQQLREQSITMAGWDDHDYGLNNYGKKYPLKEESKAFFRTFWDSESYIPADRDGIYHTRTFGSGDRTLQVIILDPRYNRDDEGPASDTLGEPQWNWLEEQLKQPATLRLIVSGYQILLEDNTPWESWSKFPKARKRLFDLVQSTGAEGVIFVTGDQHYGEVLRMPDALGYDALEFMFSGINQEENHVYARHRASPVSHAKDAYALIEIHWDEQKQDPKKNENAEQPHLTFTVRDAWTKAPEIAYRVNFHELRFPDQE